MSTFWFSENNLERLIKNVKDLVSDAKSVFTGATSQSDGTSGQLPAPSAGDQDKYLKGDGTWATPSSSTDFTGATSLANGAHGLVPQPLAGDENKCLKGDGSWTDLHSVPTFVGTQAEWNALSAAQQANYKLVNITDDGGGINLNLNVQKITTFSNNQLLRECLFVIGNIRLDGTSSYTTIVASHDGMNIGNADYNGSYRMISLNWDKTNGNISVQTVEGSSLSLYDAWVVTSV